MKKFLSIVLFCVALVSSVHAAPNDLVSISVNSGGGGGATLSTTLQILLLFTVLSVAPSILIMTTSFVRIVIVLSFLKTALTLQQPPNQVVLALALFLTGFIMAPTFQQINKDALQPLRAGTLSAEQAFDKASSPLKTFMLRQMKARDLELFTNLSSQKLDAKDPAQLPMHVVVPSYMLSELKIGFQMGLLILLPFLVIDMVVASILMALGMMMLPPSVVSLPIKLIIFVLVDGWTLIVQSVVSSFST